MVPETVEKGPMAALLELLKEEFPDIQITKVHRRYFNTEKGKDDLERLKVAECSRIIKDIHNKY